MADRLSIGLRPSVRLALWMGAAHLLGASGFWLAPIPWPLAAGASALVAISLVRTLRRHALLISGDALIELELRDDGSAAARSRAGGWADYQVHGSSFISSVLTIVNLQPGGRAGSRSVLVTSDNADPDAFRRLRVWLGWRSRAGGDSPAGDQT